MMMVIVAVAPYRVRRIFRPVGGPSEPRRWGKGSFGGPHKRRTMERPPLWLSAPPFLSLWSTPTGRAACLKGTEDVPICAAAYFDSRDNKKAFEEWASSSSSWITMHPTVDQPPPCLPWPYAITLEYSSGRGRDIWKIPSMWCSGCYERTEWLIPMISWRPITISRTHTKPSSDRTPLKSRRWSRPSLDGSEKKQKRKHKLMDFVIFVCFMAVALGASSGMMDGLFWVCVGGIQSLVFFFTFTLMKLVYKLVNFD